MRKAFFLTSGPPVPVVGARRIRDAQILSLLAKRMPVELLCVSDRVDKPSIQAAMQATFGERVNVSCHPLDDQSLVARGLDVVRPHYAQGYSKSIESRLRTAAQPGDIVWLSRLRMAKYVDLARSLGCHSVLDEHQIESDLLFDNAFTKMKYWPQGLVAARCALYEKKLSYAADLVVTASAIDASRMSKLAPNSKVQVLPHGIDTQIYAATAKAGESKPVENLELSFIGDLEYRPNLHAMEWIREELLPRLTASLQNIRPHVRILTQSKPLEEFRRDFPEFEIIGYERNDELVGHLRRSAVAIFPLRYGRGNRIHILEAIAAGIPVVTTGRGADGLSLNPLQDFCVAEQPDEFASLVMRVARDGGFRNTIIDHGLRAVRTQYDWSRSDGAMDAIFDQLGLAR